MELPSEASNKAFVWNILAGVFFLVSALVNYKTVSTGDWLLAATGGVVLLLTLLVGGLFVGWVFTLIAKNLGTKKSLSVWSGYAPLSWGLYVSSVGTLIASVLSLLAFAGPAVGEVGAGLGGLISFVFVMLALSAFWRLTNDHLTGDWTKTLVFVIIVVTPLVAFAVLSLVTSLVSTAVPRLGSALASNSASVFASVSPGLS